MAAEEDVGAALVAARHYIASAFAHLEWFLLSHHIALIGKLIVRAACAVRSRSDHWVLVRVHQTFLNRCCIVMRVCLIHVEDGLLLRRRCHA